MGYFTKSEDPDNAQSDISSGCTLFVVQGLKDPQTKIIIDICNGPPQIYCIKQKEESIRIQRVTLKLFFFVFL